MLKKLFGYFTVFDLEKHRDMYPYCDKPSFYKKRLIIKYWTPKWMSGCLECIEFDNIYNGTPEDTYDKRTCLVFVGVDNLYWIYFRESPIECGDWKWCLKFNKTSNDHTGCG